MSENNENKTAGRPKGTGSKTVTLADLALLVGDRNLSIPVPHKWLQSVGANPDEYPNWNRKTPVQQAQKETVKVEAEQPQEEEIEVEYTLSE